MLFYGKIFMSKEPGTKGDFSMKNIDMSTLSPEVAAYIRSLEETVLEQKMELVKLQSLTEQLVNLRKKMY